MKNHIDFEYKISLDKLKEKKEKFNKEIHITKKLDDLYNIDCFAHLVEGSEYLICAMPSAQSAKSEVQNPIFHRWSWYKHFKNVSFISMSDPALYKAKITGTWFMSDGNSDIIEEISKFICELVSIINIDLSKVIFYGSSMGGFGALMLATNLKETLAIAEVPQLDMRFYPFKSALNNIQQHLLEDKDFGNFSENFIERVDVFSKVLKMDTIPSFRIITNDKDDAFTEHLGFFSKINHTRNSISSIGTCSIFVSTNDIGHRPLPSSEGIKLIKSAINEGWGTKKS